MILRISRGVLYSFLGLNLLVGCGFEKPQANRSTASAQFNHNLVNTGSCTSCHEGVRPGATQMPFYYVNASITHGAGKDCSQCHQVSNTATGGSAWVSAELIQAHQPSAPTNCENCHAAIRPNTLPTGAQAGHPATPAACNGCHAPGNLYSDWAGKATGSHFLSSGAPNPNGPKAACVSCHNAAFTQVLADAKSAGVVDSNGNGIHYTLNATNTSALDCAQCHNPPTTAAQNTGNFVNDWRSTLKNLDHSIAYVNGLNQCAICHEKSMSTAPGMNRPSSNQLANSTAAQGARSSWGDWTGLVPQPTGHYVNSGDCRLCHSTTYVGTIDWNWNPANTNRYDHLTSVGVTLGAQGKAIQFCNNCHVIRATTGSKTDEHKSINGLSNSAPGKSDCIDCHGGATSPTKLGQAATVKLKN